MSFSLHEFSCGENKCDELQRLVYSAVGGPAIIRIDFQISAVDVATMASISLISHEYA